MDIGISCEQWNEGHRKSRGNALDTKIQAFQIPVTEKKYNKMKQRYGKAKNPNDSDKAFILKIKRKLETAVTQKIKRETCRS